jgi:hypothetical protein
LLAKRFRDFERHSNWLELASDDLKDCSKSFEHASNDLEHRSNHFGDGPDLIWGPVKLY